MRWVKTLWPDSDAHTQHSLHSSWPATSGPATTSNQALKHSRTPQDSAHPANLHWYLHDSPSIYMTVSVSFIALHAINCETDCSGSGEASPRRIFSRYEDVIFPKPAYWNMIQQIYLVQGQRSHIRARQVQSYHYTMVLFSNMRLWPGFILGQDCFFLKMIACGSKAEKKSF